MNFRAAELNVDSMVVDLVVVVPAILETDKGSHNECALILKIRRC
jgi:hypothetical protein